jgi:hypothetical protein
LIKREYQQRWKAAMDAIPYEQITTPWKEWFAWKPVVINGTRYWLTKVYRRQVLLKVTWEYADYRVESITHPVEWEYTTLMDYLSRF